ncbi:GTP-binding protein [Patescibacteria group bacterium]|nr:GTP-binding protein [Patescibacteria group bacterium]
MKNYLKFVIVGHVDHGKSTLIGRLLFDTKSIPQSKIDEVKEVCESLGKPFEFAYLMDYLEEEREKNITIDTTQTFFKTEKRDYVIIDAPGHKEFLKNMITGSALAEAAILIIDAKEGVQEQTKRHAYILQLLNLSQLIVVINKMDLVNYKQQRFKEVKNEILTHLDILKLKPNYIIPISAKEGDFVDKKSQKIEWYNGPAVLEALDSFKPRVAPVNLPLRFPVQDIYEIDGEKIIVGRVESGLIKQNQEIIFFPDGKKSKVKAIKKWRQELAVAETGHCVGITLVDDIDVERGQIISETENRPHITDKFTSTIFWMSRESHKINEPITFKCVTQEIKAKIKKIHKLMDSSTLETIKDRTDEIRETEVAKVEIETDKKIAIEDFSYIPELGRFVLEKNDEIVAGGIITLE